MSFIKYQGLLTPCPLPSPLVLPLVKDMMAAAPLAGPGSSAHFCLSLFRLSYLVCQRECVAQQNSPLMASKRKGNLIQMVLLFLLLSIAFGSLNSLEDEGHAPLTAPRPAFVICLQRTVASHVIGVVLHVVRRQLSLSQGCFSIR